MRARMAGIRFFFYNTTVNIFVLTQTKTFYKLKIKLFSFFLTRKIFLNLNSGQRIYKFLCSDYNNLLKLSLKLNVY